MNLVTAEGSESSLNMTPMIDIVFNLVTFFMLTLDLSHKELAVLSLPRAHHGVEDKAADFAAERRLTVNLESDGRMTFRGQEWNLSGVSEERRATALDGLRRALEIAVRSLPRNAEGVSRGTLFLRADRATRWREVQWILALCGDLRVRVAKVQFAVEGSQPPERRKP